MQRRWFLLALSASMVLAGSGVASGEPAWVSLFDGKSLKGWVNRGGKAEFSVKDGTILGTSVPSTPNSFLCTERSYGDFVLEYEFQVDEALNSGVQIRSQDANEAIKRVHGYQIEIDPDVKRGRLWTAGVYDEGRRGWLQDMTENKAAREAFKAGGWNRVRVEAFGDRLRTWLNGVPAADVIDSVDREGFVALQVHGVKERKEPLHVAWRNLRLQDWGRRVWLPLFDGKTAPAASGAGAWAVKDGLLVGTSAAGERRAGLAWLPLPVGDFTARLEYRLPKGNAGLYFRAQRADTPAGAAGLQADLDARAGSGGLYQTGGNAWLARAQPQKGVKALALAPGDFHVLTVSAHGGRVVTHLDGVRMAELAEAPGSREGLLGLELAAGEEVRLEVRRLDLLSELIPAPLPRLAVGYTGSFNDVETAAAAGFEFIDLELSQLVNLSDDELEKVAARVRAAGVPALGGIHLLPADVKVVGPTIDKAKQDEVVGRALRAAARLGVKLVVFGAAPARKAPEGFPPAQAFAQLVDFGRRAAALARKQNITLLVKAFRKEETNTINSSAEALKLVQAVNHPSFQMLIDHYQLALINEDPAIIKKALPHVRHVQIANPAATPPGRVLPLGDYESDYALFFRTLAEAGYKGGLSIEGRAPTSLSAEAARSLGFVRRLAAEAGFGAPVVPVKPGS